MRAPPSGESIFDAATLTVRIGGVAVPDNAVVIGVVTLSDLIRECRYVEGDLDRLDYCVEETLHVPESKSVDDQFEEMRREPVEMGIVIDEFGTTEGFITTEDLIEEIVGEVFGAEEMEPISVVDETSIDARGDVNVEAINDTLDTDLPAGEEFETIAGFIFNRAGRLVEEGESFRQGDVKLCVERVDDSRIMRVRITEQRDRSCANQLVESRS